MELEMAAAGSVAFWTFEINPDPDPDLDPGAGRRKAMMGRKATRKLSLADLIDLESQFGQDEALDRQELRRRDGAIGRALRLAQPDPPLDRRGLLLAWLDRMRDQSPHLPGERASLALGAATVALALVGAAIGYGTSLGVFAYTGDRPVNVVHALAVFVGLQIGLMVLWAIAVAPRALLGRIPGAVELQELLRLLSPGRLAGVALRILPSTWRGALSTAQGRLKAFGRLYGAAQLWTFVHISQCFAVAFNLGALTGFLSLIVFTDLAFSWSTTLESMEPATFHRLTRVLSAPWAWLIPQAAPTLELIEATRFFRIRDTFGQGVAHPAMLGGWWRFLMASMIFYGLAPRVAAWAFARWRLRRALDAIALDHAPCRRVLDRLADGAVSTAAGAAAARISQAPGGGETVAPPPPSPPPRPEMAPVGAGGTDGPDRIAPSADRERDHQLVTATAAAFPPQGADEKTCHAIHWGSLNKPEAEIRAFLSRRFGWRCASMHSAGSVDVARDGETLAALAALRHERGERTIALVVKAWEPPTRDLAHFLEDLRRQVGKGVLIIVTPVDLDEGGHFVAPEEMDLDHWDRKMAALGDPWLTTARMAEGA